MAIDIKGTLTNKWVLAAAGAGGGYIAGGKYIKKKRGNTYGAIGGALAGYLLGKLLEPKQQAFQPTPEQVAAAQQTQIPQQQYEGVGDYVEFDEEPENVAYVPPGTSSNAHQRAAAEREARAAVQPPPPGDPTNLSDLSEGWNGAGGSLSGGWGEYVDDDELDALIAGAKKN